MYENLDCLDIRMQNIALYERMKKLLMKIDIDIYF